ncbi:hypothetical protein H0A66_02155 [Alcaligenaceae bacterium]|nr:hypothetical protein [Alcaligenaceae bacterium]
MSTLLYHPQSMRLTDSLERDLMRQSYVTPLSTPIVPALKTAARTFSRMAHATWRFAVEVGEMRAARAIDKHQYWY